MADLIDRNSLRKTICAACAERLQCTDMGNVCFEVACINNAPKVEADIDRAAILRLCNEIEDAVTSIDKMNPSENAWYELCFIRDKLKAIGKELTGNETERTD